jgi:hypothetical protein
MNLIIDTVNSHLPPKRKVTPSGWISFNAVCCQHNGNSIDTRQRGGIMLKDSVSYHCFNCGFKASWKPGRKISIKFKKLLRWLNVSDDLITKCSIEAMRLEENSDYQSQRNVIPEFIDKALPLGAEPIVSFLDNPPAELMPVLEYMMGRGLYIEDYPFYWTPEDGFNNRLIVPFYYQGRTVGYTARLIRDGKIKYISEQQPGYVFNLDRQIYDRNFVIVVEGPMDAICINGVALTGSEVSPAQQILINQLQKEVIIVPDRDQAGSKLVEQALEFNWSVSFPDWPEGVKDINDAVLKIGRLATLWLIVNSKESNNLKIQLKTKKWFNV